GGGWECRCRLAPTTGRSPTGTVALELLHLHVAATDDPDSERRRPRRLLHHRLRQGLRCGRPTGRAGGRARCGWPSQGTHGAVSQLTQHILRLSSTRSDAVRVAVASKHKLNPPLLLSYGQLLGFLRRNLESGCSGVYSPTVVAASDLRAHREHAH